MLTCMYKEGKREGSKEEKGTEEEVDLKMIGQRTHVLQML